MATAARKLRQAKQVARDKYAWPGGYPLMLIMSDGECICPACVKSEWRNIARSTITRAHDGWTADCGAINWEDDSLLCAHCGERIESAYGEN